MSEVIVEHNTMFDDAIESMRKDDSKSRILRFTVECDEPTDQSQDQVKVVESSQDSEPDAASHAGVKSLQLLEAQGIVVYDRTTGQESHVSFFLLTNLQRLTIVTDNVDD